MELHSKDIHKKILILSYSNDGEANQQSFERCSYQDAVVNICLARICSLMSVEGQQHFNSWRIISKEDLHLALQFWELTRGCIEQSHWSSKHGQSRKPVCYKCQKPGHRAADCCTNPSFSLKQPRGDSFQPSCFACETQKPSMLPTVMATAASSLMKSKS